jgi:hypothetical protein
MYYVSYTGSLEGEYMWHCAWIMFVILFVMYVTASALHGFE